MQDLVKSMLAGDKRALARAITLVENKDASKNTIMSEIYPHLGHAYVIGITGTPGAGKSSMTDCLIKEIRKEGLTVGVIAIDPNSPFSGGAILGDRIRMQSNVLDPGVFIRSMSTRGSLGGLSQATVEGVKLMDAFGMDIIIIETVGVGQSEFDVMNTADTTLVVLNPGGGDGIQSIKAGIMEIADIFVVNKADLPGVEQVVRETEAMLMMRPPSDWRPPVTPVIALQNQGFDKLWEDICKHRKYFTESGERKIFHENRKKQELFDIISQRINSHVENLLDSPDVTADIKKVTEEGADPYGVSERLLEHSVSFK